MQWQRLTMPTDALYTPFTAMPESPIVPKTPVKGRKSVFGLFKRKNPWEDSALALYSSAVGQARQPVFFTHLSLPDSVNGRLELVLFHVAPVIDRVAVEPEGAGADLAQTLFDLMMEDMDKNLREIGVSDTSIGKYVKNLAQGFYGRAAAYRQGLAEGPEVLHAALTRNLYGMAAAPPTPQALAAMSAYLVDIVEAMAATPFAELTAGRLNWPPLPTLNESPSHE